MRSRFTLSIGVVMVVLGVLLLANSALQRPVVTSARALDVAFAVFFLLRGTMNVRRARRPAGPPIHPRSSQS